MTRLVPIATITIAAALAAPSTARAEDAPQPTPIAVDPPSTARPAERPPSLPPANRQRFGVDGTATVGPLLTAGVSLRYENEIKRDGFLISRVTVLRGLVLDNEDNGFFAGTVHLGYRGYWGAFFAAAEGGVAAIRRNAYTDMDDVDQPARTRISPSAAVMIGGKWSGLELGASLQFPFVGLGVHLGVDLAR